jgi:hypothetical protein
MQNARKPWIKSRGRNARMARTPTEDVPPPVCRFALKNGDRADPTGSICLEVLTSRATSSERGKYGS